MVWVDTSVTPVSLKSLVGSTWRLAASTGLNSVASMLPPLAPAQHLAIDQLVAVNLAAFFRLNFSFHIQIQLMITPWSKYMASPQKVF